MKDRIFEYAFLLLLGALVVIVFRYVPLAYIGAFVLGCGAGIGLLLLLLAADFREMSR